MSHQHATSLHTLVPAFPHSLHPLVPTPTQGADDRVVVGIGRVDRGNSKSSSCMLHLQCHHGGYHCSIPVRDKTSERSKGKLRGLEQRLWRLFLFFFWSISSFVLRSVCVWVSSRTSGDWQGRGGTDRRRVSGEQRRMACWLL